MRIVRYLFGARREDKANLSLLKVFTISCEAIIWAKMAYYHYLAKILAIYCYFRNM